MRLIDADYIPYTMLYKENWMKGSGEEAQGAWKRDIDKMPTIYAVPVKHGKWVVVPDEVFADSYFCSVCRNEPIVDLYGEYCLSNYCPNCGADIRERKDT